jgi:hypothetical protein
MERPGTPLNDQIVAELALSMQKYVKDFPEPTENYHITYSDHGPDQSLNHPVENMQTENADEQLTFIVGGQPFKMLRSTLQRHDCYLTTLVSGRWGIKDKKEFIIDRSPVSFQHIVDYLQGYEINVEDLNKKTRRLLEQDADFYALPEIIEQIEQSERWLEIPQDIIDKSKDKLSMEAKELIYALYLVEQDGEYVTKKYTISDDITHLELCEVVRDARLEYKRIQDTDEKRTRVRELKQWGSLAVNCYGLVFKDQMDGSEIEEYAERVVKKSSTKEQQSIDFFKYCATHIGIHSVPHLVNRYREYRKPLYYRFYEKACGVIHSTLLSRFGILAKIVRKLKGE